MQHGAEEGITGTGGLDGVQLEACLLGSHITAVGTAAILAQGQENEGNVKLTSQPGDALVIIFLTGEPLDLIVGDFQNIAMGHQLQDILLGHLQVGPQRGTEIGIVGAQATCFLGDLQGMQMGAADRLVGHREGAEVENLGVFDNLLIHFFRLQHHISAGIAVEAEVTVAVGIGMDYRQGGMHLGVILQAFRGNTGLHQALGQLFAETVLTHLADEGGLMAVLTQAGQHIARCSAGIGLQDGIPLLTHSVLGEVNEQLTQGCYIVVHRNVLSIYEKTLL